MTAPAASRCHTPVVGDVGELKAVHRAPLRGVEDVGDFAADCADAEGSGETEGSEESVPVTDTQSTDPRSGYRGDHGRTAHRPNFPAV